MAARKPLIAGNWKMYGRAADLGEIATLASATGQTGASVETLICPPAVYLQAAVAQARSTHVKIGAQDCSPSAADAARTGEISAAMLAEVGAAYVIVGHSERRQNHGETSALVRSKADAALAAALTPIICVGETIAEREAGRAADVVAAQVAESIPERGSAVVVAYEPVWAIGGNRTPTSSEITEIHAIVRQVLLKRFGAAGEEIRILYGGSVGPKNADEIFAAQGVDGALVGRASLKAADFAAIVQAHPAAS